MAARKVTQERPGAPVRIAAAPEDAAQRIVGLAARRANGPAMKDRELLEAILDVLLAIAQDRGLRT